MSNQAKDALNRFINVMLTIVLVISLAMLLSVAVHMTHASGSITFTFGKQPEPEKKIAVVDAIESSKLWPPLSLSKNGVHP